MLHFYLFIFVFLIYFFSGLCTILRSEAGGQDEVVDRGGPEDENYKNNFHLLPPDASPGRSNHVGYYDAAALYPSSGEFALFFALGDGRTGRSRGGGRVSKKPSTDTQGDTHADTPCPPPTPPLHPAFVVAVHVAVSDVDTKIMLVLSADKKRKKVLF